MEFSNQYKCCEVSIGKSLSIAYTIKDAPKEYGSISKGSGEHLAHLPRSLGKGDFEYTTKHENCSRNQSRDFHSKSRRMFYDLPCYDKYVAPTADLFFQMINSTFLKSVTKPRRKQYIPAWQGTTISSPTMPNVVLLGKKQ